MLLFDRYAWTNGLKDVHPMEKFAFALGTAALCLAVKRTVALPLAVLVLMALVTVVKARIPLGFYLKQMLLPSAFLLSGVIALAVDVHTGEGEIMAGVSLFGFHVGIHKAGTVFAGKVFLRSYAAFSCLYFLALTTPVTEIMSVLKIVRAPVLVRELALLIYRFIFVLMETAQRISLSQSSRLGYGSMKNGYRSLGLLVPALFLHAFRRSRHLYDSLLARGYRGELTVLERSYRVSLFNVCFIVMAEGVLLAGGLLL